MSEGSSGPPPSPYDNDAFSISDSTSPNIVNTMSLQERKEEVKQIDNNNNINNNTFNTFERRTSSSSFSSNSSNSLSSSHSSMPSSHSSSSQKFEVSVTDPEKKGEGMYQFISYKINTTKESSPGKLSQSSVVRRFSDFVWLHNMLVNKYKGLLVPPIPEKAIIGRFSGDFISERKRALENFLNRIANHPDLCQSSDVDLFLHGDDEVFTDDFVSLAKAKGDKEEKQPRGLMASLKESIQSISNQMSGKEREKSSDDIACDKVLNYAVALETSFTSVQTNADVLVKRTKGLANTWFEFGLSCSLLGQFESQNDQNIGTAFSKLGSCADRLSILLNQARDNESVHFLEPFKDYIRILKSVQQMMKIRSGVLITCQTSLSTLESRQGALAKVQGVPGKQDKQQAAEKLVAEAQAVVDRDQNELHKVTQMCLSECQRFQKEKYADLKNVIIDFCKLQIEHSKKVQNSWEHCLSELEALP